MNLYQSKLYLEDIDRTLSHIVDIEKLKNKSILITGSTGTIGSFLADVLIRFNENNNGNMKIYLAGRNVKKLRDYYGIQKKLFFLYYDMNKPIEFNVSVDYIIHAAGNAHPAAFNNNPTITSVENVNSTYGLLEYLRMHNGKRLLYVSSGEVYGIGDVNKNSFDESYVGYVDILSSRSCYPLSKRMSENICSSYWKQYGIESVVVRPCHTYGPYMTKTDNRAHVQFFNNAINGENIVLKSSGTQMRSYNYVADCVSALLCVLLHGNSGEAYNLANPQSKLTIAELAKKIGEFGNCNVIFEKPNTTDVVNQSPIPKQVLNSEKIEKLGWRPAFDLEEGISHTLDILKKIS